MKYIHKVGTAAGTFTPFLVGKEEVILTSVSLMSISPGDRLELRLDVGWEKPIQWESGEIELRIRKDAADGPVIYWKLETCIEKGYTMEKTADTGVYPVQHYYLTACSCDSRAIISGPYSLQGSVYPLA
ncbi:hypothetical protein DFP94_104241 [Fontibacillus phaseoli]|uniref:Uncharacterized protein n=1 Tax=Fontibacillus phaseoli TaxID=1416533 RepID=A0A369BGU7_9BACL|nr:hypothetical protein [Fontibacillus phaseoli]RCX19786.1 hypothetical protein DFP94_104241 [Fontibacillus phaseoli]